MTERFRIEHRQRAHRVRLEWGPEGATLLARDCAAVVVVDVLSFCTAVDVAVGRGAEVLPQRSDDPVAAVREAGERGAVPAGSRHGGGPSLRPSSLVTLASGTRLALPSPNGATLCAAVAATGTALFAGCLRNASAVAAAALDAAGDGPIGIVAAGERWPGDTLRVAVEDAVGAGAIAAALGPGLSPEAAAALAQFRAARAEGLAGGRGETLFTVLAATSSGQELIADGFAADVTLAATHDCSSTAPRLRAGFLADPAPRSH